MELETRTKELGFWKEKFNALHDEKNAETTALRERVSSLEVSESQLKDTRKGALVHGQPNAPRREVVGGHVRRAWENLKRAPRERTRDGQGTPRTSWPVR